MANEIQLAHDATAETLYAVVRNTVGQVWQTTTSTFVSYATANIANYDIALVEQGTASRYYAGTFPTVAAGIYSVSIYVRAGGSPAEGDDLAGAGSIEWDGTAVVKQTGDNFARLGAPAGASIAADVAAVAAKTTNLPSDPADASDISNAFSTVNSTLTTIAGYIDTEVSAIKSKTDSLTFTVSGKVDANALAIDGSTTAAVNQKKAALAIVPGSVTGAATTTTLVDSSLTQADDFWIGRVIIFLTGALTGQATNITDFTASTDTLTFTALTNAPSSGDTYIIV